MLCHVESRETSRSMAEIEIPPDGRNDRLGVMSYVFQTGFAYALAAPEEQQRETSQTMAETEFPPYARNDRPCVISSRARHLGL